MGRSKSLEFPMTPSKHAGLPVAPSRSAVPPTIPSQPSYEQQQLEIQRHQLELIRNGIVRSRRGVFGWIWLGVRIVVGVIMALIILIPVTQCSMREYESNKNGGLSR